MLRIRQYGPPQSISSDNEGGLNSDEGRNWATRWNLRLRFRPVGTKAWTVERHNDLLRRVLHTVHDQMAQDGVNMPPRCIVVECVFAKN